jgi:molecular chaperone GrpE
LAEENEVRPENEVPEVVVEENIETLKRNLAEEKEKSDKYLANWQRAEADFSNYKRRAEQEKNETTTYANWALTLNLLPVLDDLERAITSLPPKLAKLTWVDGILLIHRKLRAVLESQGLTEIEAIGKPFEPSLHEAVAQVEGKEGIVINEVQKGYKLKDKLLRPALVVVGKGKEHKQAGEDREKIEEKKPNETIDS